ncbi:MAG: ATP-binding protein [Bdellovibrionales bacterium]|nr:ATP-binding protein [Bdellovibrionales bacterium]
MVYKKRIIKVPDNKNIFLFGVRGSGKTAMLKRLYPSALYIDLLDESRYQNYLFNIGLFYEKVSAFRDDGLVIVDEIQRMPQLLNEVHRLIESSNRRFILTGSSARKIKTQGVNLLGGRAGTKYLYPFIPEELGEDFNLEQALRYGLLPIIWSSYDRSDKLKDYVGTYLKEEIKAEALVRHLPSFARFLEVAGLYHGQIVNISAIAREAKIDRRSVREFFSILEDTMLGFFLSAYSPKLRLREQKGKKFYFIDPGLARTVKKNFGSISIEEKGFLFEGLVAQILRTCGEYYNLYDDIYYWSSLGSKQTEVDFLLKRGKELIAIEVKAKADVSSRDYRGLKAIGELSNVKRRIVVYMGKFIRKTEQGFEIWPFDFFCKNLKEDFESPVTYEEKKSVHVPFIKESIFLKPSIIDPTQNKKQLEEYKGLNWSKNKKDRGEN